MISPGFVGTTLHQRRFANLSLNQEVRVRPFDPLKEGGGYAATLTLMVLSNSTQIIIVRLPL